MISIQRKVLVTTLYPMILIHTHILILKNIVYRPILFIVMHYLLSHIQTINKSLIYFCIDWEVSSIMEKFCYVFTMFKEKDTYALMCHPVGRHNDKFKNGITSKLENCFCMFLSLDQHNKTNVKGIDACENNYSCGRGRN